MIEKRMILKRLMKKSMLPLVAMAILSFPHMANAEVEPAYEVPEGPVTLYGQELNPYFDYYETEEYKGYQWDKVKHYTPEIFPDAKTNNMSAIEVCDMMVNVVRLYKKLEKENFDRVVEVLKPKFPDVNDDSVLYDKVATSLQTRDPKALNGLLKLLPDYEFPILMTRKVAMKNTAISMLHDAALVNCPDYAAEKGYTLHTASQ